MPDENSNNQTSEPASPRDDEHLRLEVVVPKDQPDIAIKKISPDNEPKKDDKLSDAIPHFEPEDIAKAPVKAPGPSPQDAKVASKLQDETVRRKAWGTMLIIFGIAVLVLDMWGLLFLSVFPLPAVLMLASLGLILFGSGMLIKQIYFAE